MATYEEVVEMLGSNLASFLELAKKLLITWGINPKKLIHLLYHLKKEALIGLMDGTHEITAKATASTIKKEDAECIFEKVIVIPDMDEIVAGVNENWGSKIGGVQIPVGLRTGEKMRFKIFEIETNADRNYSDYICFFKTQKYAIFPNVFGLQIAETNSIFDGLTKAGLGRVYEIFGPDEIFNFARKDNSGRPELMIPSISRPSFGGGYVHETINLYHFLAGNHGRIYVAMLFWGDGI